MNDAARQLDALDQYAAASQATDSIRALGYYMVEIIRDTPDGPKVIQRGFGKNLVVNTGKRQLWRMASGLNTNDFDQGRVGSSSAAVGSGDTNVITPITGTLNTVDSKTLLAGTRTMQYVWSYPSGVGSKSGTIKEMAILNQNTSPGGSALSRALISPVAPKSTSDKAKITYRVRIT